MVLTFRATAVGIDTALSRIVQLVQNADVNKAPALHLADTAGKDLVSVAPGSNLMAFQVWMLFGQTMVFALTTAVSIVVIACPDALALARPTAIMVGVGKAARESALLTTATAFEGWPSRVLEKTAPTLTDCSTSVTTSSPTYRSIFIEESSGQGRARVRWSGQVAVRGCGTSAEFRGQPLTAPAVIPE
ncbi:cation transport ATPase [Deinococcus metalli]|uniref:Cation transport ATPase n=1 Tax=Deinococcus metalli TaxID=1141878 RepID=A0A7W8KH31_9DEIO|nr:hypothetical protein [Deinococcus metalli]MBB5377995.1 cation transport ATPase [Deinococcus metalli]GHF53658.1 hypothetical protein GCM10017781_32340 [Deinococcus metalli]